MKFKLYLAAFACFFLMTSYAKQTLPAAVKPVVEIADKVSFTDAGKVNIPVVVTYEDQKDTFVVVQEVENPTKEILTGLIQTLTGDPNAEIILPGKFDANDPESVFEWWMFLYALGMPLVTWVISQIIPNNSRQELIARSTITAVVVLMIIIGMEGASALSIGQAALAFIFQSMAYDNGYKAIGLSSRRTENYK